ncbi:MAG: TrkH family potassium uptake protein [Bacteroides sp.]|jgi:trk system potassium uptake protein TrkH|nr:TrkH family potassium uptake protein [Bacteroides sp.]
MSGWSDINIRLITKFIGILLMLLTFFMALSALWSWYYNEEEALRSLAMGGGITFFSGFLLFIFARKNDHRNIGKKEGYLIVTLTWLSISAFGALPFYLNHTIPSYTDAFFETISGFTTTGASILTDIESVSKGLLFWRSMTHWLGGMGIIVLTLAILPILGVGGMQLFVAEAPGTTPSRLHPRIAETAKRLWGIYFLITGVQTILLMLGDMSLFDALNHAFSTMATGGFSTKNDSVAGFSPYIQYVIIFFMILAGTNFSLHYFALKGQLGKVFKNEEYRFYLSVMGIFTLVIATVIFLSSQFGFEKAFRDSLFQVVSIVTTTGFVSTDYLQWEGSLWFLLFLLMFTGGCIGSTGGGIKMIRHLVLLKNVRLEFKRLIHPMAVIPVRINGKTIPSEIIHNFLAFFMIYVIIVGLGSVVMAVIGLDFISAVGATVATLGNVGPGIGSVGPVFNYAHIPDVGKWVLSFLMLLGRLELFTVLLILTPGFYRK